MSHFNEIYKTFLNAELAKEAQLAEEYVRDIEYEDDEAELDKEVKEAEENIAYVQVRQHVRDMEYEDEEDVGFVGNGDKDGNIEEINEEEINILMEESNQALEDQKDIPVLLPRSVNQNNIEQCEEQSEQNKPRGKRKTKSIKKKIRTIANKKRTQKTNTKRKILLKYVSVYRDKDPKYSKISLTSFRVQNPMITSFILDDLIELMDKFEIVTLDWNLGPIPHFVKCENLIIRIDEWGLPLRPFALYVKAKCVEIIFPIVIKANYKMSFMSEIVSLFHLTGTDTINIHLPVIFLNKRIHSFENFITLEKILQIETNGAMILFRNRLQITFW